MAWETLPFTAQQLVNILEREVGHTESPRGSNRTPYGRATGLDGQPWCAILIGWGFQRLGGDLGAHLGTHQWRYTPSIRQAGAQGGRLVPLANARPGDLVTYDFPDEIHRTQHVGVCLGVNTRTRTIRTVEGNTSPAGVRGSQANGGAVAIRERPWAHVSGVVRPVYRVPAKTAKAPAKPVKAAPPAAKPGKVMHAAPARPGLPLTGHLDTATITRWQQIMHTPADGVISTPRSSLVAAVQGALNKAGRRPPLAIDGALGAQTITALQNYLGVAPADGIAGPQTITALQKRLNLGRF